MTTKEPVIVHYVVTNEKFILLEFVLEPLELVHELLTVSIFTIDCTDDLNLLAPIHTLSIVSVKVAISNKVKYGLHPWKFVPTQ